MYAFWKGGWRLSRERVIWIDSKLCLLDRVASRWKFNGTGTRWGNAMQWIMGYCLRRGLYYKLEHDEETMHWIMHVWSRKVKGWSVLVGLDSLTFDRNVMNIWKFVLVYVYTHFREVMEKVMKAGIHKKNYLMRNILFITILMALIDLSHNWKKVMGSSWDKKKIYI